MVAQQARWHIVVNAAPQPALVLTRTGRRSGRGGNPSRAPGSPASPMNTKMAIWTVQTGDVQMSPGCVGICIVVTK